MKALIIGNQEGYEKFMPSSDFIDSVEKVYIEILASDEEILKAASDADVMAVDAIAHVSGYVIERMPNLKLIQSEGVAYNGIDVQKAAERGVIVCNNKGINAVAVAEQTILLMLGLLRSVREGDMAVRQGRQIQMKERRMIEGITELRDCKVGLVGFGDIAQATARLLRAFGCPVFYYTRKPKPQTVEEEFGVSYRTLETLAEESDIVSVHVPVTPETTGMIDTEFLRRMKPSAYLINTARGEIVDNEALCMALTEGWIAGAGLDTVYPEPVTSDNPLVNLPEDVQDKILFSPHLAGITTSTFLRAHQNIWEAFEKITQGEIPKSRVV